MLKSQPIMYNTIGAYYVKCVCHVVQRDNSTIKVDRVETTFFLALFHWLKQLTSVGGQETGVPGEKPNDELQKMPYTETRIFKPQSRLELAL